MATPQWLLVHKRLLPLEKEVEDHFERNARRRHRQAVQSALRKGFLKVLDQDLILQSQGDGDEEKARELDQVLRISIGTGRGVQILDDLAILSCSRLRVCNLAGGYLTDISAFNSCTNLLKLDLSDNQIVVLPDTAFWSSLSNLRVLYLHGNQLSRRECLVSLGGCPQLHILTAYDTPLSLDPSYRHIAVNCICSLKALDHYVISDEEVIENLHLPRRFRARTSNFHLHPYQVPPKDASYREELQGVFRLLLRVTCKLAHHSPVMIIQRFVRGWLTRKMLAKSSSNHICALVKGGRHTATTVRSVSADNVTNILRRAATKNKPSSPSVDSMGGSPLRQSRSQQTRSARKKARTIGGNLSVVHPLPPPPPSSPVHHFLSSSLSPRQHRSGSPNYRLLSLSRSWDGVEKVHAYGGRGGEIRVEIRFSKHLPGVKNKDGKRRVKRKKSGSTTGLSTVTGEQGTAMATSKQNTLSTVTDPGKERDADTFCVTGDVAKISQIDRVAERNLARKEDGHQVREGERWMKQRVVELKRPSLIDHSKVKPSVTKDTHDFNRAHTTVSLAALKTLDRVHRARQRASDRALKVRQVARAKLEREERKEKITEHQEMVREAVLAWRAAEELRLEQERAKQVKRLEEELVDKAIALEAAAEQVKKRQADEEFASKFSQHNAMVGHTLLSEDRRVILEAEAEQARKQLQEAREAAAERQEIVRRYMQMREDQMRKDACTARQELNTRMIQVTSQRLLEAKQKVAREVARRRAAKAAMEAVSPTDFHTQHSLSYDLPKRMNLLEALSADIPELSSDDGGEMRESRDSRRMLIPVHMRRLSREAHRTWQRGSRVLVNGQLTSIHPLPHPLPHTHHQHFKKDGSSATPLAYNRLHPLPHLHNHHPTPDDSSSSSSSNTNTKAWLSPLKWPSGAQTSIDSPRTVT